jgi:serine/threonine-protein kinase 19
MIQQGTNNPQRNDPSSQRAEDILQQIASSKRKRRRRMQLVNETSKRVLSVMEEGISAMKRSCTRKTDDTDSISLCPSLSFDPSVSGNEKPLNEEQKRIMESALDDIDDELINSVHFGTVNLALLKLKKLCEDKIPVPIMLKHMLHAMLPPNIRTQIERELDELIGKGIIRQFNLYNLEKTAIGYCYTEDLIQYVRSTVDKILSSEATVSESDLCDLDDMPASLKKKQIELWKERQKEQNRKLKILAEGYITDLIPKYKDTIITHSLLTQTLKCDNSDLALLMKLGLFLSKSVSELYFNVPESGRFVMSVKNGRIELQSILGRKKYKEMMLHTLRERRLKKSHLSIDWHIKELMGLGLVQLIQTSNGIMVQLK